MSGVGRYVKFTAQPGARDAIRIAPSSAPAFEAGPDGLELLVFGPHAGDAVVEADFWPLQAT